MGKYGQFILLALRVSCRSPDPFTAGDLTWTVPLGLDGHENLIPVINLGPDPAKVTTNPSCANDPFDLPPLVYIH